MKITLKKIVLALGLISILWIGNISLADTPTTPPNGGSGNITSASDIFNKSPEVKVLQNLPATPAAQSGQQTSGNWILVVSGLVKILLNIAGALALLGFTIGGVLMIVGTQGKPDLLDKGKQLIKAMVAGLIVIAVSYALVLGVSELQFFTPGAGPSSGGTTGQGAQTPAATPAAQPGTGGTPG